MWQQYHVLLHSFLSSITLHAVSSQTNIRLVPGDVSCVNCGRLEVLIKGEWGTVCSNLWTENDARVACRQLHFLSGGKPAKYGAFGKGQGPIHMSHVSCRGDEASLLQCPHRGGASCSHEDDAGVVCESAATVKQTGSVRLVDGNTATSGRVVIQYHGVWGTVCRDGWNIQNSRVVCRSLGYCGGSSVVHDHGAFGWGTGPVWLTEVTCIGGEPDLQHCRHAGWANNSCDHGYDVGVVCDVCPTGMVRLKGGHNNSSGFVTISNNGIWGTICSDFWSDKEARVICRGLGFGDGFAVDNSNFTYQTGPVWLSGVRCNGYETDITKCYHDNDAIGGWGSNECRHYQDVAVRCIKMPPTTTTTTSTVSGTKTKYRTSPIPTTTTTRRETQRSTTAGSINITWIIIIVALAAALVTLIVVSVSCVILRVKASNPKNNLMLNPRGEPNNYTLDDGRHYAVCATPAVRMPERRPMLSSRDSELYEEINDYEDGDGGVRFDNRQPPSANYNPNARHSRSNRKETPLPEPPREGHPKRDNIPPPRTSFREARGWQPAETAHYLEPRNVTS